MRELVQEASELQPFNWLSPIKANHFKSDDCFDIAQNPQYWEHYRSFAGSPFDSSDSESDSDCGDDALSVASLTYSLFKDVDCEGIGTPEIMGSNALGLIFISEGDVLEAKDVTTITPQAESLRAPRSHQDARSCDRPDQNNQAQQVRPAFQSDGPTDETLARRFPQDIGMQGDVSDSPGFKVSQGLDWGMTTNPVRTSNAHHSLPEVEEDGEDLFYGGSDLGGWLTGALDGVPKAMSLDCLDFGFQEPFAMVY
ncbi:hypothetical protein BJV77DRAFT_978529 [Russula vinacea]|nr:hypothetical protein BJV77DRAFT_978529 [Russula vinacea]